MELKLLGSKLKKLKKKINNGIKIKLKTPFPEVKTQKTTTPTHWR